jgi:hypothetical protein
MAFPPHIQVAIKMLPHLIMCAKTGRQTSYEELGEAMNIQSRLFSKPLAFIRDDICLRHGLPPLTAVVENKGADRPINSFAPAQLDQLTKPEYERLKNRSLKQVFDYPKWDMALRGLQEMYCVPDEQAPPTARAARPVTM